MKTMKYSRQREAVKSSLASRCDHPTADMIYEHIREEFPNVSLGTVYRNLNLLVDLGEAIKITCGDGKDHFDITTRNHYHFICTKCSSVSDVPMKLVSELDGIVENSMNVKVSSHQLNFYGLCDDCMKSNE